MLRTLPDASKNLARLPPAVGPAPHIIDYNYLISENFDFIDD
jgi:hypothetical protein